MRIVSLLPSATEIVCALGMGSQLVGVSHECDYPEQVLSKPKVTSGLLITVKMNSRQIDTHVRHHIEESASLQELDAGLLQKLKPDLILTQELCHVCAASYDEVEKACRTLEGNPKIVSLEPHNLSEIFESIVMVGELTEKVEKAREIADRLHARVKRLSEKVGRPLKRPRVVALEWIDPPWVGGHWIPEMVQIAGGFDGLGRIGEPSRRVEWEEVAEYAPELVVAMPCGFDVKSARREAETLAKYPNWGELPAVKAGCVYAVDASSYFSRSGPRIVDGLDILASILKPQLVQSYPANGIKRIKAP